MAPISNLQHMSIYCRELEPMHPFYAGALGLEEIARPHFPFPGHWFEAGKGRRGRCRVTTARSAGMSAYFRRKGALEPFGFLNIAGIAIGAGRNE